MLSLALSVRDLTRRLSHLRRYDFIRPIAPLSCKGSYDTEIPLDKISFSFARSSGPGGQNVNKLNTKAELRFHVDSADWIPVDVRNRLQSYQSSKINKEGEIVITSQEHRTQSRNREDCIEKLRVFIAEASIEPKERSMWEGISEKGKETRRQEKRQRGQVKDLRRSKGFSRDFDD